MSVDRRDPVGTSARTLLVRAPPVRFVFVLPLLLLGCTAESRLAQAPGTQTVPSDASVAAETRYLALGDSFTAGTGATLQTSFPARLTAKWASAGRAVTLENVAVNGYTTGKLIDVELPALASFSPTFVTLAIGANDIVHGSTEAAYRAALQSIFAAIASASVPLANVVALPQPDWSRSPVAGSFGDRATLAASIATFNAALADEAKRAGARYVDLTPTMNAQIDAGHIAPDGLHPSAEAYDAWAAALMSALAAQ